MLKRANKWLEKYLGALDLTKRGYVVNKKLTRGAFLLCVALLAVVVAVDGFDVLYGRFYAECPEDSASRCTNPFYNPACVVDCAPMTVPQGWSYGEKPSWLAEHFNWFVVVIMGSAVGLNHLLYNKKGRGST